MLENYHTGPTGGHYHTKRTAQKILELGFYWPTLLKDPQRYVQSYGNCLRSGNISYCDEMP